MAQSVTTAQALVQFWRSLGCVIAPGVPEQAITSFEHVHSIRLPADVREYFGLCDGLSFDAGGHWDRDHDWAGLIRFWPLEEVTSLDADDTFPKRLGPPTSYFMFADFLIDSHVYVIRLTADPDAACPVILYAGTLHAYKVGDSFSDFVGLYLSNPNHVVAPPETLAVQHSRTSLGPRRQSTG